MLPLPLHSGSASIRDFVFTGPKSGRGCVFLNEFYAITVSSGLANSEFLRVNGLFPCQHSPFILTWDRPRTWQTCLAPGLDLQWSF
jgi:hypothetical protein